MINKQRHECKNTATQSSWYYSDHCILLTGIQNWRLLFDYFSIFVSLKCDEATSYYQGMEEKEATKRGYVLIDNYMVYNFTLGSQGYDGPVWIGYSTHS